MNDGRVFDGVDEAIVYGVDLKGAYIDRIKFNTSKLAVAYENLSQLIRNFLVDIPEYPELMAELSVFKSAFTYDEKPDYSLQVAQQSGLNALCLVTYDLDPTMWEYRPDIWAPFEFDVVY